MDKSQIAKIFEEIAIILELQGENPFRIRAYRNAAHTLLDLGGDLTKRMKEGTLTKLPGIGADLAEKITTLMKKGKLPFYEKLKKSIPPSVIEMMQVHGLGGKRIKMLYEKLKIKSIAELKSACQKGKLSKLRGWLEKKDILNTYTLQQVKKFLFRR